MKVVVLEQTDYRTYICSFQHNGCIQTHETVNGWGQSLICKTNSGVGTEGTKTPTETHLARTTVASGGLKSTARQNRLVYGRAIVVGDLAGRGDGEVWVGRSDHR